MAHAMRAQGWPGKRRPCPLGRNPCHRADLFCDRICDTAAEAPFRTPTSCWRFPWGRWARSQRKSRRILGRRSGDGCGFRQGRGGRGGRPAYARWRAFHSRSPLYGTEYSAAVVAATLFQNRWWLLTPLPAHRCRRNRPLRGLWKHERWTWRTTICGGGQPCAHAIAYTMVGVADHMRRVSQSEVIGHSASGFRDHPHRGIGPVMWRDVFLTNKEAVLDIPGRFAEELFVCSAPSVWRTATCTPIHPHPRHSPRIIGPGRTPPRRTSAGGRAAQGGMRMRAAGAGPACLCRDGLCRADDRSPLPVPNRSMRSPAPRPPQPPPLVGAREWWLSPCAPCRVRRPSSTGDCRQRGQGRKG